MTRPDGVKLDFRSGGWVILLSVLVMAGLIIWRVVPSVRQGRTPYGTSQPGLPYNGFDLSTCLVPRELIAIGIPRDTLLPLDEPPLVPADRIEAVNREFRKYLLPGDRVIGVTVAGQARAYPLRVMAWHEVCNDTLGGTAIAVTYSPLCDSAAVFERQVGGRELHFGVSGLLYNSNLLMYDRPASPGVVAVTSPKRQRGYLLSPGAMTGGQGLNAEHADRATLAEGHAGAPQETTRSPGAIGSLPASASPPSKPAEPHGSSLWSQLQFRAIAGPAAAQAATLEVLPAQVVYWSEWRRRHPDTSVVAPDPAHRERYNRDPYASYYGTGRPRYPVQPLPADATLPLFEPVIAVQAGKANCVYPFSTIARQANQQGHWTVVCGATVLRFEYRQVRTDPPAVWVSTSGSDTPMRFIQSFWFAWHAMHPGDRLVEPK